VLNLLCFVCPDNSETAKLFLSTVGADLYKEYDTESAAVMARFRSGIKTACGLVSNWEPAASLFVQLETLIDVRWQDPQLQLILHGEEIEEKRGRIFFGFWRGKVEVCRYILILNCVQLLCLASLFLFIST
jgi:hypothetical protein